MPSIILYFAFRTHGTNLWRWRGLWVWSSWKRWGRSRLRLRTLKRWRPRLRVTPLLSCKRAILPHPPLPPRLAGNFQGWRNTLAGASRNRVARKTDSKVLQSVEWPGMSQVWTWFGISFYRGLSPNWCQKFAWHLCPFLTQLVFLISSWLLNCLELLLCHLFPHIFITYFLYFTPVLRKVMSIMCPNSVSYLSYRLNCGLIIVPAFSTVIDNIIYVFHSCLT